MTVAALIGLDWGTTSARAYLLGRDGQVLAERGHPLGVGSVRDGAFAAAFATLLGDWAALPVPRIACGMVGSRQGWVEVPYCACPAPLTALAEQLSRTPGGELIIVPGISCVDAAGVPDVIRGEETQILGACSEDAEASDNSGRAQLVVLPGTHSKWAVVADGAITAFATYMTGEVFAVMKSHSILGRMMTAPAQGAERDAAAFRRGVQRGLAEGAGLLHELFGARTLALFGELSPQTAGDYLSGLLIGDEIRCGRAWALAQGAGEARPLLVGAAALTASYADAFGTAGLATALASSEAAAHGLWRIAGSAGVTNNLTFSN